MPKPLSEDDVRRIFAEELKKAKIPVKNIPAKDIRQLVLFKQPHDPIESLLPHSVTSDLLATDYATDAELVAHAADKTAVHGIDDTDKIAETTETGLRIVRGIFTTNAPTINEGSGFTLTRNGVGDVTVNFTIPFSDVPAVVAMSGSAFVSANLVTIGGAAPATASAVRLFSQVSTTAAQGEGVIHFIAIGPA